MPELPEVETVTRGIQRLVGTTISGVIIRNSTLRYPIDADLDNKLLGQKIVSITRRAKYIVIALETDYLLIHLGMSGSITLANATTLLIKHDHVDITCGDLIMRYNDPRRFGCIVYTDSPHTHSLIKNLGPEPLDAQFNAAHLYNKIHSKKSTIKQLIMDNHIVVGVGNIYASEALFLAHIAPTRTGNSITQVEVKNLVIYIKQVLAHAIELGGSSLRDYKQADGNLGYFQNAHNVYGRAQQKCKQCQSLIVEIRLGQRNSFYCPTCQH